MPQKIILDKETFRALATESRVLILKHLKNRRYMQTELAELLQLAVPTVKEHLDAMDKAGLVLRIDEGRKWKYYELSPKGRAILEPEEEKHQLWIVLSVTAFAFVGGIVGVVRSRLAPYFSGEVYSAGQESLMAARSSAPTLAPASDISPEMASDTFSKTVETLAQPSWWSNPWLWVYAGVVGLLMVGTLIKYLKYRNAKKERDRLFSL